MKQSSVERMSVELLQGLPSILRDHELNEGKAFALKDMSHDEKVKGNRAYS